ncbi:hypothetical protein ACFWNT_22030 [Streptomyces sp. NPDC058409]|uniref:MmyB family transcriptional regulator n=1 Tax=Streptomyces sp. NPDC058409 TaxID=3346484 RepID=UPI003654FAC7
MAGPVHHPVAGDLALDRETLTAGTDSDRQLVIRTAEPGTPSYEGLRLLASWAAGAEQSTPRTAA